ncbi:MAG TPA: hypothetical protein VJN18_03495 [Polyangiaceae bacterium]|nr:hypothetical protein [Polyangiaceae bacterium]
MTRGSLRLLGLAFGPLCLLSCGPSVQSIYEGNVRFEHCYRLDLELEVASSHRQACWTTWLDRYTYGQSRDRLEYARRRVRAFAAGDANPPALKIGGDDTEQETRQFYLVVPAPTSVHASPPPIATRVNAPGEAPPTPSSAPPVSSGRLAPGEDCSSACRSAFSSCNEACAEGAKSTACKSCDPDYKKCMQRCFE